MFSWQSGSLNFDQSLVETLFQHGPRYVSYPTADQFDSQFGQKQYQKALQQRQAGIMNRSLSLSVSFPFNQTNCYYCHGSKNMSQHMQEKERYVAYLGQELNLVAQFLAGQHQLTRLHIGSGSPDFLSTHQLGILLQYIQRDFQLNDYGEHSIDIDPKKTSLDQLTEIRKLGFNRLNISVQDFDKYAINHTLSLTQTQKLIAAAKSMAFKTISVDIMYGLPEQNLTTIQQTVQSVLSMEPDRVSLCHHSHFPNIFSTQKYMGKQSLPSVQEKIGILQWAVKWLESQGYVFIGMDQFVKDTDILAQAWKQGRLQRNLQGYSTHGDGDVIGIGLSNIGKIGATYIHNTSNLKQYYQNLDAGILPIKQGFLLSPDDILRRNVIDTLMCQFGLIYELFEEQYGIVFKKYFANECIRLHDLAQKGLIELNNDGFDVTPNGRFLIRHIAAVFDRYLRQSPQVS